MRLMAAKFDRWVATNATAGAFEEFRGLLHIAIKSRRLSGISSRVSLALSCLAKKRH